MSKTSKDIMIDIIYIINNLFLNKQVTHCYSDNVFSIYMRDKPDIILPQQTQFFLDYNILEADTGNLENGDTVYVLKERERLMRWLRANATSDNPHLLTLDKNNFLQAIRDLKLSNLKI